MAYLYETFQKLNAMVARAASRGGAELVDTYTPTIGHDMCKSPRVRYAEAFGPSVNDPAIGVPAHPNAAGARAQARAVLNYLRTRPEPDPLLDHDRLGVLGRAGTLAAGRVVGHGHEGVGAGLRGC